MIWSLRRSEELAERAAWVGVIGVGWVSVFGWEVAPVFVHPHPAFGVLADRFLEMVPDLLCDGGNVVFRRGADGTKDLHPVGAIGPRNADTRDD